MESATGSRTGKHYLSFNFETTGSVFTQELSDKVDLESQLSRLFTLLLSILALFRFVKMYAELVIDHACLYLSGLRGIPVSEDVKERINILEERQYQDIFARLPEGKPGGERGKKTRATMYTML